MSGRGGRGRGGRGGGRGGRGRGRGHGYTGTSGATKKGLCNALGPNVFDYGDKAAADRMRTSWEKVVQYVGAHYGQDISNELQNKIRVTLPEPTHSNDVLTRHATREALIRTGQHNIRRARLIQQTMLEAAVTAGTDADAPMRLAILGNEIAEGEFELTQEVPIEMTDSEKTQYNNAWRTFRERNAQLTKHRGQSFSLILGQSTQLLQDKMKQDTDWVTVSTSYDPLTLYRLIERTVLAQTEDQYPFATVYEQEIAFFSFRQETIPNAQWYERFNTKVDVSEAIGVTRQHKALLEYVAQETHTAAFDTLSDDQKLAVREDAEERYLAYAFLKQSGKQHATLKTDLQNDFTTGDNRYPKNRQQTLHLLDKYSKTTVIKPPQSEGTAFAQKGGKGGGGDKTKGTSKGGQKPFDKDYWADKKCFKCDKMGHPASHCQQDDDDDKSRASQAKSVKKLTKDFKDMKKAFAQMQEATSDISSDSEPEDGDSHFQFAATGFQFAQLSPEFEPRIAKLFKQSHPGKVGLDLRNVILLDSQSTMDLFCNRSMVQKTFKSSHVMRLHSNGGEMNISKKATMAGYHQDVWFSKNAITNIIALSNVIKQYKVTYDSDDQAFVVHREPHGKPNMEFRMHESGLHYFDPSDEEFSFVTTPKDVDHGFVSTVNANKEGFTKRQIKRAETARTLYTTLSYPSWTDFRWIVRSNQIKDCPVTVEDVDNAMTIWGKNISALKGKTTRSKPSPVARDFVKVPKELLKLHKDIFLTMDIFFVNKIPFFLTLSRKICFTAVNHLANRKVPEIFEAFKEIYQYYLHRGFRITTVHADGEFEPLRPLIEVLTWWSHCKPGQQQRARSRNRTSHQSSKGEEPSESAQHAVSTNPQAADDSHCILRGKASELLPDQGRCIRHPKPEDNYVWRDAGL